MRSGSAILVVVVSAAWGAQALEATQWNLAQVLFGQRCQTQQGWCVMGAPAPVGSQCFCPTPFGPVPGFVVQ